MSFFPAQKGPKRSKRVWGRADAATLGGRIQLARVQGGMTQAQLGAAIGSTRNAIAALECSHNDPSLARFVALARALDVSLDYLAGLAPEFGTFPLGDDAC